MTPEKAKGIMDEFHGTILFPDETRPLCPIKPIPIHLRTVDFVHSKGFLDGVAYARKEAEGLVEAIEKIITHKCPFCKFFHLTTQRNNP